MPDENQDQNKGMGAAGQTAVAVAVGLLLAVAATAPWWWREVFPKQDAGSTTAGAQQAGDPESLSRTPASLSGDAIDQFRVANTSGRTLVIEVDVRSNEQHGRSVMLGAWLRGLGSAYAPAVVTSPRRGTAMLTITARDAGTAEGLDIFLYEGGRPGEPFARRTFTHQMRFE